MEWQEQMEAAAHRLDSARRASSSLWRLRHMQAALGHLAEATRQLALEERGEPHQVLRETVGAGRR